jgi:hypothetical protein
MEPRIDLSGPGDAKAMKIISPEPAAVAESTER